MLRAQDKFERLKNCTRKKAQRDLSFMKDLIDLSQKVEDRALETN